MVEELLQADRQVLAVAAFAEVVGLVVVLEEPGGLAQAAEAHEHLDALVPRNGAVIVVVHDQDGRLDVREAEEGRVLHVEFEAAPEILADAGLRLLVLELAAHAGFPADAAVGRCHVGHRRPGARRLEDVRARDQERDLVAAPTLALDGHVVLVNPRELGEALSTGHNAVVGTLAGDSASVNDVRDEHHVTP